MLLHARVRSPRRAREAPRARLARRRRAGDCRGGALTHLGSACCCRPLACSSVQRPRVPGAAATVRRRRVVVVPAICREVRAASARPLLFHVFRVNFPLLLAPSWRRCRRRPACTGRTPSSISASAQQNRQPRLQGSSAHAAARLHVVCDAAVHTAARRKGGVTGSAAVCCAAHAHRRRAACFAKATAGAAAASTTRMHAAAHRCRARASRSTASRSCNHGRRRYVPRWRQRTRSSAAQHVCWAEQPQRRSFGSVYCI